MKGVKKWFIACLTLLGLCVPSFLISSDVNALQYTLSSIPFVVPLDPANNGFISDTMPLRFREASSSTHIMNAISNDMWYFDTTAEMVDNDSSFYCIYYQTKRLDSYSTMNYNDSFYIPYYPRPTDNSATIDDLIAKSPTYYCQTDEEIPSFKTETIPPYVFGNPNLAENLPYRFPSSGAYLHSNYKNDQGLDISTKLNMMDLFEGDTLPTFSEIDIPIGISGTPLTQNQQIEFKGEWLFDADDTTQQLVYNSGSTFKLHYVFYENYLGYLTHNSTRRSGTVNCIVTTSENPNWPTEAHYILNYTCPVTVPINSTFSYFVFNLAGPYDSQTTRLPIWEYPTSNWWTIDSSLVITDGDDTPTDDEFQAFEIHSSHPETNVPGYAGSGIPDITSDGVNWSESFRSLFIFNFINPFAPLFDMFTDNNSCVNIPTIASMIHSEETEVCPWFDSTTRNIATPVLGLSSMMLVFGFAVRWLGSRSGNMVEDDFSGDAGGFNIGTRRRTK